MKDLNDRPEPATSDDETSDGPEGTLKKRRRAPTTEGPRQSKVKRRKVLPTPVAAEALAAALRSPKSKPAKVRAAFETLASSIGAHGPDFEAVVRPAFADMDSHGFETLTLELTLSHSAIESSGGASAKWMQHSNQWLSLAAIASTFRISASDYSKEAAVLGVRRQAIGPLTHDAMLLDSALFHASHSGLWIAPLEHVEAEKVDLSGGGDSIQPGPPLPLTQEISTRRDLLCLARMDRRAKPSHLRARTLAMKAIGSAFKALEQGLQLAPATPSAWDAAMATVVAVGRNPELWNLFAEDRVALIRSAPLGPEAARTAWASAVAATWAYVPESNDAVGTLGDLAIAPLCRAARDHDAPSLLKLALGALGERANARPNDSELWALLETVADASPLERRWLDALRSGQALQRHATPAYQAAGAWQIPRLQSSEFESLVGTMDANAAIPALSLACRRLAADAAERAQAEFVRAEAELRGMLDTLRQQAERVSHLCGGTPPGFREAVDGATERVGSSLRELREISAPQVPLRKHGHGVEAGAADVDLISTLERLAFDPSRSTEDAYRQRAEAVARLAEIARSDPSSLGAVVTTVERLSAEAIGVIWQVGIVVRSELLLESADRILNQHRWGQKLWAQLLAEHAADSPEPVPAPKAAAEAAVGALSAMLREERGSAYRRERLATAVQAGRSAAGVVADEIDRLAAALKSLTGALQGRPE